MIKIFTALSFLVIGFAINPLARADVYEDALNNSSRSDTDRVRDISSKSVDVLKFVGVKPGMKVLDLFSGGGYYSELLAYVVGSNGHVIAHTNDVYKSVSGKEAGSRFKGNRLSNVSSFSSEIGDLGLEKASLDMILMVLSYHDIYYSADYWPKVDRDNFFKQVRDSLKQGGILAIIDHAAKAGTGMSAAQELHRIDEVFAKQDIESAGFSFAGSSEVLRNPDDDRALSVFDEKIRRKTDRFIYRFVK